VLECSYKKLEYEEAPKTITNLNLDFSPQEPIEFNSSSLWLRQKDIVGSFLLDIDLRNCKNERLVQSQQGLLCQSVGMDVGTLVKPPVDCHFPDTLIGISNDRTKLIIVNYQDATKVFGSDRLSKPGVHEYVAKPMF